MKTNIKNEAKELKKSDVLELNVAYRRCLYWFFSFPDIEISLNDLKDNLEVSKTTARRVVLRLVEEKFLIKKELGKIWRISCNKQHFYNHTVKISHNLEEIYLANIIPEVYKIVPNARAIILFGSYRNGDNNEESDIDIAVEVIGNEKVKIHELGVVPKLGYRKNVSVNLFIFSRNKVDLNLFANIVNGIVLEGILEVKL